MSWGSPRRQEGQMEEHGLRRKLAATIVALLAFLVFMTIGVLAVFTDQRP